MTVDIFLSHSFQDKNIVNKLRETFSNGELECYVADEDRKYGKSLPDKIMKALDECQIVIVILTKKAETSASVNQEIGYAKKARKLIIPMMEEGVLPSLLLQGLEYIKFNEETIDKAIDDAKEFVNNNCQKMSTTEKVLIGLFITGLLAMAFYVIIASMKK